MISHVICAWSVTWAVHDQSRDQCMINYLISAWSVIWTIKQQEALHSPTSLFSICLNPSHSELQFPSPQCTFSSCLIPLAIPPLPPTMAKTNKKKSQIALQRICHHILVGSILVWDRTLSSNLNWASLVAQRLKHLPAETWVQSLGQEDSPGLHGF